jgi:hypothetical protein
MELSEENVFNVIVALAERILLIDEWQWLRSPMKQESWFRASGSRWALELLYCRAFCIFCNILYSSETQKALNSFQAFSRSSLITTLSKTPGVFAKASSFLACVRRWVIASSESVARPRRRCSRISRDGGWMER